MGQCGVISLLILAPWGWHCPVSPLAVMSAHKEHLTAPGLSPLSLCTPNTRLHKRRRTKLQSWTHGGARELQLDHSNVDARLHVSFMIIVALKTTWPQVRSPSEEAAQLSQGPREPALACRHTLCAPPAQLPLPPPVTNATPHSHCGNQGQTSGNNNQMQFRMA